MTRSAGGANAGCRYALSTNDRQPIRDHDLLEQAPEDQLQAGDDARAAEDDRIRELLEERSRPFDRAGEQLRKERQVQQQAAEMPLGRQLARYTSTR